MKKKSLGFTITEVIVSITVLILIIGIIFALYTYNHRAYRRGETSTEVLQNGRVILERLTREIRQTDEVITSLPDVPDNPGDPPPDRILFHDGHVPSIFEEGAVQEDLGSDTTIKLSISSSDTNDYYKDIFLKIIEGTGNGQIRKIMEYDGATKIATIKGSWTAIPDTTSNYSIDSYYYYIRYFKDNSNLKKRTLAYYASGDPNIFVPWNDIAPPGETIEEQLLEEEVVGEYLTNLRFWGSPDINVSVSLEKGEEILELQTTVLSRNL